MAAAAVRTGCWSTSAGEAGAAGDVPVPSDARNPAVRTLTAATATTVAMPTLPKRAYRRERGAIDGVNPTG